MPLHDSLPLRERALSIERSYPPIRIMGMPEPDRDLEDNDDAISVVSATSTTIYQQEPFETFGERVLALAQTIWTGTFEYDFIITRLPGGLYDREIGITKLDATGNTEFRSILRTPRFDNQSIDSCLAGLIFVKHNTSIPAPDIVAFDESDDNVLGCPYMVQTRLPGIRLSCVFPGLSHAQKCLVATRLGGIYREMLSKKDVTGGRLALHAENASEHRQSRVTTTPLAGEESRVMPSAKPDSSPAFDLIVSTLEAGKAENPEDRITVGYMDKFIKMMESLKRNGCFDGVGISLHHLNFHPEKILVDPAATDLHGILAGVLGWDDAILGPSFMSCAPPQWIWAWLDNEDEDERTANDTPTTPEGEELKSLFEKAAGPEYMCYAYDPAYRLARRLVRFALEPMRGSQHLEEADAMLKEWHES